MMTSSNGNIFRVTGPSVRGIHRSPVNSPHEGQWRGALMFPLICAWTKGWVNIRDTDYLSHHRAHCDVPVTLFVSMLWCVPTIGHIPNVVGDRETRGVRGRREYRGYHKGHWVHETDLEKSRTGACFHTTNKNHTKLGVQSVLVF